MASRGKRKGPYPYWQWISSGKRKKTKDNVANSLGESFQEDSNTESSKIVQWKEPRFEDGVQLSAQQQYVLDLIRQGKNVFYTGNAGTGKTTLLKEIRKCAPEGTFVTALTGVAAVQAGGTTLHSFAGIGLGNGTKESLCDIVRRGSKAKNWRKAKVLIIDELSMLDGRLFDKLEYIACEVRNCKLPFGGLQLVVCGDFFQLPPIQKVGETSINYCFQSKSWDKCIDYNIELTQIYRQSDPRLIKLLYEVRYQCLSDESLELLNHLNRPIPNCADIEPTKLYSHNARVNDINNAKLMCLPGQEMVYTAEDHGQAPYVDNMSKYVIAMDRLVLKIGAQVMLLKNLTEDLINGSRGVVEGFDNDGWPQVKFVDGQFKTIKQEEWNLENSSARVLAVRTQVPLKLAWAITIHKSQGMSIDFLQVDLKNVFSQGQAYVALSRARTLEGLQVLSFDVNKFTTSDAVIKFYQDKVKSAPTNQSNTAQDTSTHFFTPSYLSNSATSTPLKRKRSSKDNDEIAEKQSSKVSPSEERSSPSIYSQKRLDKRSRRSETNTTPSRDGKEKMSPNNHTFKHLDERSINADSTTFSNTVTTPSHDRAQESAKLQSPSFPSLPSFSQSLRGFQKASHLYQSQNQPMGYQIIKEEGDSKHLQPVQSENHSVFHEKHKANDNQFVDDDILDSKSLKAVLSQNECLDDVQENVDISNDFNDFSFGDDDISDSECIRASQESLELFSEELPGSECLEESKTKSTNSNEKLTDLELAKCDSDQEEYRQESTTEQTPFTVKRKRHRPTTSTKTKKFELQQTTFTSMPLPSKTMLSDRSEKSEHCNKSRRESGKKYARLRERSKKKCSLLFEKLKDESVNSEADIISAGSKTSCVEDNISLNNKNATWYENTQGDIDCSKVSYGENTYKGSSLSNSSKCSESNQEDKSLRRKKSKRKTSDKASTVQSTEPLDIKRSQERSKERCGQLFDSLKDESNTCTPESSVIEDTSGKINSKSRKSQSLKTSTTPCAPRAKRKSKNSDEINLSSMEKQSLNRCTPRHPRNRKQKNENSEAINSSDMKTQLYLNTSTPCTLRKRKERTENSEEKNSSDMKIQLLNTSTPCTLRKRKERNENSEEINSDKEQELKPSSQCPPRSSKINENVSSNRTVHSQYRIPKRKNYTDNITVTTNVSTQTECSSYSPRSSSSFDIHFQLSGTSLVMTDLLKQLFCLMLKLAAILHRFMITMFIEDNIL